MEKSKNNTDNDPLSAMKDTGTFSNIDKAHKIDQNRKVNNKSKKKHHSKTKSVISR